jgi:hypothetical protein
MNIAVKKHSKVRIISSRYNYMPFGVLHVEAEDFSDPYVIHAAGFGWDKNFPEQTAGQMKERALLSYEYKFKGNREELMYAV